jgi:predicted dinucleotide-binding enzyme
MRIAIIGTGKMGRGFGSALSKHHQVVFGSRNPARAAKVVQSTGALEARGYANASAEADVVILAVPWRAMDETLATLSDLDGVVVVDISAPLRQRS